MAPPPFYPMKPPILDPVSSAQGIEDALNIIHSLRCGYVADVLQEDPPPLDIIYAKLEMMRADLHRIIASTPRRGFILGIRPSQLRGSSGVCAVCGIPISTSLGPYCYRHTNRDPFLVNPG